MEPQDASPAARRREADAWRDRDLAVVWHPCTQMKEHPGTLPLVPIRRGRGAWLEGVDGTRYLDAVSSWWTNLFGHAEPRIADAIAAQARELEHVIYAGFSHEPGLRLAEALVARAPPGLSRVFYGDNGSAAVEIALKMSFHSHANRGDRAPHPLHRAGQRLPRRNPGRAVHGRHPAVPPHLRAAAARAAVRALARRLRGRARRKRRSLRPAPRRPARGPVRGQRRPGVRADPGAAGAVRRRHAHVPPGLPAPGARNLRRARRAPDRRRDRGGLRPHRHPVRLRAGRHRARFPVPVQGPDRRLPADVGGADHGRRLRRLPGRLARARLPAFAQLHRQPAGLRGRPGVAGHLRKRRRAGAQPRPRRAHGAAGRADGRAPERRRRSGRPA